MKKQSLWIVLFLLAVLLGPRFGQAQLDRVFPKGVPPVSGTVVKMDKNSVTIDVGGSERTFQVNQILRVAFLDDPATLSSARDRVHQGNFESALESLKTIDASGARNAVQQDLAYYKAYCEGKLALSGGGDKKQAGSAVYAFVRANPNSYHFYEAAELLGDLLLATSNYDNAIKFYSELAQAPWDDYKLRAAILMAQAKLAKEDYPGALQQYDIVLTSNVDTPEVQQQKQFALVGKAICLAQTGSPEQGIQAIEKIIADNDPTERDLFARAYNALGSCYRKANKPKDALLAFLHVDLMYNSDTNAHAEALYHLAELWNEVNQADRAVKARSLLKSRYAGTRWAK